MLVGTKGQKGVSFRREKQKVEETKLGVPGQRKGPERVSLLRRDTTKGRVGLDERLTDPLGVKSLRGED